MKPVMNDWQSIESAPKDRPVLLRHVDKRILHASRSDDDAAWVGQMCGLAYHDLDWQFTHWKLP